MDSFTHAESYELFMGRWSRVLGHEFVRFTGLDPASRVLDVGCGTGALTAAILARPNVAEVVGIDPSPAFVEAARDATHTERARFESGDAQQLPFPTGHFDCAMAMLVLNFVPNPRVGAAEMQRVTRPGGRVAACVWDYGGNMIMLRRFWDAAMKLNPSAEARRERAMPLCREGELEALWMELGMQAVREGTLTIEMRFTSFADYWEPFLTGTGPSGSYVATLGPDARQALEARLRKELWDDRPHEPRVLPASAWAVVGTVPGIR